MRTFFQYLQKKPKEVRNNYAFGFALTITSVVALLWFVSFSDLRTESGFVANQEEKPAPFFATIIKKTKEQMATLKMTGDSKENIEKQNEVVLETSNISSSTAIVLSEETIEIGREALVQSEASSTTVKAVVAIPVLIATTTATTVRSIE